MIGVKGKVTIPGGNSMLNRRARSGNRRKSPGSTVLQPDGTSRPAAQNRRQKNTERRIDSIQAAFVNMQR